MDIGYLIVMQNGIAGQADAECWKHEVALAELAEPLGFNAIWSAEHHFDAPYSMIPDNLQLLSYLAGRTANIKLVTGAIIVPWWTQPLRVAEKIVMLDLLSHGRLRVGLGRGLSRMEYASFGIDMGESRDRFDEATDMILNALATGVMEGDGKYFHQPRAVLAPAPTRDFRDGLVCIAMSPDSLEVAARLKAAMATFVQFPIEQHKPLIDTYKENYRTIHDEEPPPPILTEFTYCHEDPDEAERVSRQFLARYFTQVMRHYEIAGEHFATTRGYESYDELASLIRAAGQEKGAALYAEANTWGTPEQIVEKVKARREVIGAYDLNCVFSFGGLQYDKAEASMRLFAEQVIPQLKAL